MLSFVGGAGILQWVSLSGSTLCRRGETTCSAKRFGGQKGSGEPTYNAFEELLRQTGGRSSSESNEQSKKLPPRNGFVEEPSRNIEPPPKPEISKDDQYRMFDDFLSGKPNAGTSSSSGASTGGPVKPLQAPPSRQAPPPSEKYTKQKYNTFDALLNGTSAKPATKSNYNSPPSQPAATPSSSATYPSPPTRAPRGFNGQDVPTPPAKLTPPPRFSPSSFSSSSSHPSPSYADFDQLLTTGDALNWSRQREKALPPPRSFMLPTIHVGDSISADQWTELLPPTERQGILSSPPKVIVCLIAPSGGSLSSLWLNLLTEINGRVTIDDVNVVAIAATETQKALDRVKRKRSLRFPFVVDDDQQWSVTLGQKRSYLFEPYREKDGRLYLRVLQTWKDISAEGGHVDELVSAIHKQLGNCDGAPVKPLLRPPPGSKTAISPLTTTTTSISAVPTPQKPTELPNEIPELRTPLGAKFTSKHQVGDEVTLDLFGDINAELMVVCLAPNGTATPEWVRVLSEISSKAMLDGVSIRGVASEAPGSITRMAKKQGISFPIVSSGDSAFFSEFGQRCTYLFEVLNRGDCEDGSVDLKVLHIWNNVVPGSGHGEAVTALIKSKLKEFDRQDSVAQLVTPVERVVVVKEEEEAINHSVEEEESDVVAELKTPMGRTVVEEKKEEEEEEKQVEVLPDLKTPIGRKVVAEVDKEKVEGEEEEEAEVEVVPELKTPMGRKVDEEMEKEKVEDVRAEDVVVSAKELQKPVRKEVPMKKNTDFVVELTKREMRKRPVTPKVARSGKLVVNHSTNIKGLLRVLNRLCDNEEIKTIIPGEITSGKGSQSGLQLRVTIKVDNGLKMIARQGPNVQEIFVVTTLTREQLIKAVTNVFHQRRSSYQQGAISSSETSTPPSNHTTTVQASSQESLSPEETTQ